MAAERKARINIAGDTPDLPDRPELYRCGTEGVWVHGQFEGAYGCLGRFPKPSYDFHSRTCIGCRNRLCAEFEVERDSCGPLAVALDRLHAFRGFLPGLAEVTRREAVRMLVMASQGVVLHPSDREQAGAAKIVSHFPAMMGCWPSAARDAVAEAVMDLGRRLQA